jgi:hypothetical protein
MNTPKRPRGPQVPLSEEERQAAAEDAAREAAEERAERDAMAVRARHSARILVACAAGCSAVAVLVAALLYPGPLAWGVAVGTTVMTLNLGVLARLMGVLMLEDGNKVGSVVLLFLSFLALGGVSIWLIQRYPDQNFIMGFGLGLGVPAVAGLLWSLFRKGGDVR